MSVYILNYKPTGEISKVDVMKDLRVVDDRMFCFLFSIVFVESLFIFVVYVRVYERASIIKSERDERTKYSLSMESFGYFPVSYRPMTAIIHQHN